MIKVILLLINTLTLSHVFSQKELSINVLNPPKKVSPGGHFTLFFEIIGLETNQSIAEESLVLPKNWQLILSKKLDKDLANPKYIYTVATSSTSNAGAYPLILSLANSDGKEASKKLTIEVSNFRKIEIIPLSSYEYVKEGDSLHLDYLIQNLGNSSEKVSIKTSSGKIELKNDSLTIAPNKSMQVRVNKLVPKSQSNFWLMSNDLFVTLHDSLTPIIHFNSVPVYSNQNKKSDPYLRFPIETGVWYSYFVTDKGVRSSYQYDARGHGFLDFKQTHYLDFIVHGPNQIHLPVLGNYDQYFLSYSYKKQINLSLGDYLLSFNNLMEFGRFGRGFRFDQNFKRMGFSTFYTSPRFYPFQKDTYGLSFYVKPKQNLKYSLDFLSKQTQYNQQWFIANFIGVTANYRTNSFFLNSEAAMSSAQNKLDFGFFNRVYYHYKKIHLNSDIVYAGKNFYGFYHNSWQAINAINYNISKKISIGLQSNFTRVNPSFDFYAFNSSPYFSNNSILLNYDIKPSNRLILSYNLEEKEDKKEIKQFHFRENYGRLAYLVNKQKFNLWFENRLGYTQNYLSASDDVKNTQSIQTIIQPLVRVFPCLWLGTFFEYQQTSKFSTINQLTNYYYYGGTSRITVGSTFNLSFSYRNNYAPDELIQKRSFVDLTAELNTKHHKLSLMGGRTFIPNYNQTNENTLFFMLKYSLKLNVPIAKNNQLGSIKGHISSINKLKKEGILVSIGSQKFMTDANGNFYFNDLVPDKYYITLEKSTIETGVISETKTPIEVQVNPKTIHDVSIPLVRSGGVVGKIHFKTNDEATQENKKALVVLIKLFNEQDTFMTKVNDKGEFSFREIKPGQWNIEAIIHGNKDSFVIENLSQNIIIESEKLKTLSFSVVSKERKIYFSNQNFLLNSKK
ncbi:hypothetical protein [Emticicia sp. SJ17W-69]|uniref:hypothetical protein n=1 Tax=Emticicia sp. SJ17W-69 TaxID=3421657 RepID=UPI003EBF0A35